MATYTSATQRLCDVIISMKRIGNGQGVGTPLRAILVELELADPSDLVAAHHAYLGLVALAEEARDEVHRLFPAPVGGEDGRSATEALGRIVMAETYAIFLGNSVHSAVKEFMPIQVDQLGMLAFITTRDVQEQLASESLLDSLRAQLDAAADSVLASDLDARFKEHFVLAIERLRRALATYRVYGSAGVDRAVGELLVVTAKGMDGASEKAQGKLLVALNAGAAISTLLDWLKVTPKQALAAAGKVVEVFRSVSGS